ncbi:CRYD, partial [Symbiodinium sp. CCMP2456]
WASAQSTSAPPTAGSGPQVQDGAGRACCNHGVRVFHIASKKPLRPRRPRSPRNKSFTKPTPVRRIVAPPPQPLGCAALVRCQDFCRRAGSFEVPSPELRRSALGGTGGIPFMMQRVLQFAETWFEPIQEPRSYDWLGKHR